MVTAEYQKGTCGSVVTTHGDIEYDPSHTVHVLYVHPIILSLSAHSIL